MLTPAAHNYQYYLLGGILGEILELPFVGNYLKENEQLLRDLGVEDIRALTLSSLRSAEVNARTLLRLMREDYQNLGKKIVIFAHSKACLEVLLALCEDHDFFDEAVERIVCVQPPFQGSVYLENKFLRPVLKIWPGLRSLRHHEYTDVFVDDLVYHDDRSTYLRDRLLVIRAYKSRSRDVSWILKPTHFLMRRRGDMSDGLVPFDDQDLPFADYEELILEMDHSDLFTSTRLSNRDSDFRRKLMVDLINSWINRQSAHSPLTPSRLAGTLDSPVIPS